MLPIVYLTCLLVPVFSQYTFDDSNLMGRQFDGIGGLSGGGATSKLLPGYPKQLRDEILDYLFTPGFGAALQILKVEIGGGSMSGVGSEATHIYFDGDENYNRGYEWWMMKEAKLRNPKIKLYGLPWVFSGVVSNGTNSPYTSPEKTVDYIIKWIVGAKTHHNLDIDYIGEWNEQNYDGVYLKRSLLQPANSGVHYSSTKSIIGEYEWGKQLWSSEDYSTFNDIQGARCWARILNQNYVNGLMTSTISWNLIAAYYEGMPYQRCGLMTANSPWSGSYSVDATIWMSAHTTQFTEPGWKYLSLRSGVGHLVGGGSYVSLTSPDKKDLTIVIETIATGDSKCLHETLDGYNTVAQNITFKLKGSFANITKLNVWFSMLGDSKQQNKLVLFENQGHIQAIDGVFKVAADYNQVFTLTTIETGSKGQHPTPPQPKPFPMPYTDNFDVYADSEEPYFVAPMSGSFEVISTLEPNNKVLRQMTILQPVDWCETENFTLALLGNISWAEFSVETSVSIDMDNATNGVFVAQRINSGGCYTAGGQGLLFFVYPKQGTYEIWADSRRATLLSYGPTPALAMNGFNKLALKIKDGFAEGYVNDVLVFGLRVPKTIPVSGFAAFGTSGFGHADFDYIKLSES